MFIFTDEAAKRAEKRLIINLTYSLVFIHINLAYSLVFNYISNEQCEIEKTNSKFIFKQAFDS